MVFNRRNQPRFWLLNCCVLPQSEIGKVKIDRSMIGGPTNFRHIGHMGAGDLTSSCKIEAVNCLLSSKGSEDYAIPVPSNLREKDIPIQPETTCQ
uniref:CRIB domain-containing protein n=2 Tax=Acrobeloides nanus TaxID=290746 RepID=A0A914CMG5_9BILA